jgi:hypothetical protein
VDLLDGLHVLLQVDDGMLPRLQPLSEEAGGLIVRQIQAKMFPPAQSHLRCSGLSREQPRR